jgi:hypothetical protein
MKSQHLTGSSDLARDPHDFYLTPRWATEAILDALPTLQGTIWEPACGDGAISKVLAERGYRVTSTDRFDRGFGSAGVDFLSMRPVLTPNRGTIITNPPYKLAVPFVDLALEYAQTVVMLLKLNFLAGQRRKDWWASTPLKTVYVFSRRVSFDKGSEPGKGAGVLEYAWFHWEHGYEGAPAIAWL